MKEQRLIRDGGRLEESLQLVPTPQALVSEGIAEAGLGVLLDEELSRELVAALADQGYDADLDEAMAIGEAQRPLGRIGVDAALMIHEEGGTEDDARAYVERWGLRTPDARRPRRSLHHRSDLARLRDHVFGGAGSLRGVHRRRPGEVPHDCSPSRCASADLIEALP